MFTEDWDVAGYPAGFYSVFFVWLSRRGTVPHSGFTVFETPEANR